MNRDVRANSNRAHKRPRSSFLGLVRPGFSNWDLLLILDLTHKTSDDKSWINHKSPLEKLQVALVQWLELSIVLKLEFSVSSCAAEYVKSVMIRCICKVHYDWLKHERFHPPPELV